MTTFEITPLIGPLPISFGMTQREIESLLGEPINRGRNYIGETEWNYGHFHIVFGDENNVVEVGFSRSTALYFKKIDLFRDDMAFAGILDGTSDTYDCSGTIVIPSLGITLTGFHNEDEVDGKGVTVFAKGRWDEELKTCEPFNCKSKGT